MTLGFYGVVWNYYHWRYIKYDNETESGIWPVPRAIFSVFFIYSLFKWFDESCEKNGVKYSWSPGVLATLYIVGSILSNVIERMFNIESAAIFFILSLTWIIVRITVLVQAQKVANIANGDPEGSKNNRFTIANILWIIFGTLMWLLVLVGYFLPESMVQ